jgi:hypothetical protein
MCAKLVANSEHDIKGTLITSEKAKLNQEYHYIYIYIYESEHSSGVNKDVMEILHLKEKDFFLTHQKNFTYVKMQESTLLTPTV